MEYVVIAHRSRSHTIKLAEVLKSRGIACEITNTPKEAGVGCGLSIKISPSYLSVARRIVYAIALPSFAGIFLVKRTSNGQIVRSI